VGPVLTMGQGRIGSGRERSSPKIIDPCVSDRALSRALGPPSLPFLLAAMSIGQVPLRQPSVEGFWADRLLS